MENNGQLCRCDVNCCTRVKSVQCHHWSVPARWTPIQKLRVLVISLKGVNQGFWSQIVQDKMLLFSLYVKLFFIEDIVIT